MAPLDDRSRAAAQKRALTLRATLARWRTLATRASLALLLGTSGACATTGRTGPAPPPTSPFDSVFGSPPLDQVQWGVLAVEAESGRVIHSRQSRTKFIPGSNMKVPVTAAALHSLGPEYRFETSLAAAGPVDPASGVLTGDLVLVGTGDPTLSSRFWEDTGAALGALADSLRVSGVREVTGALVVDASAWDSLTAVASWMVEDLPDAATGGAFVLAEGVTTVIIEAAAQPGGVARVSWTPHGEQTFVASRVETVATPRDATPLRTSYRPESRQIVIDGRMVAGTTDTLGVGTRDPVRQAAAALARALADAGIQLRGGWRVAWTRGESLAGGCATGELDACPARVVARVASPPLIDIVGVVLGSSHNWMAEQLVRALGRLDVPSTGAPVSASPATGTAPAPRPLAGWTTGLSVVRRYLVETVGVDSLDLRLRDGSGLSAQNVVTPRAMVQVLGHARTSPWGEGFRRALAEPGESGTTLSGRLQCLEGRVFGKTGTLTNVAALSGYLTRSDGRVVIFSILTNGSGLPGSRVQAGIDQLVRLLAGG